MDIVIIIIVNKFTPITRKKATILLYKNNIIYLFYSIKRDSENSIGTEST